MNYPIICVSREYASGGRDIAKQVAKTLNIPFYDRTIVEAAAVESGLSPEFIEKNEQTFRGSTLFHLAMGGHTINPMGTTLTDQVFIAQRDIILNIAKEGPCVIVGRCADYILRNQHDLFTVFIHADFEARKARALEEYECDLFTIEKVIRTMDKQRSRHYHYFTDRNWGDREYYDLMLNSTTLGADLCAELIVKAVQERMK